MRHGLVVSRRTRPRTAGVSPSQSLSRIWRRLSRCETQAFRRLFSCSAASWVRRYQDFSITTSRSASSVDKLIAIDECAAAKRVQARVHLKIDTGMERIGTHWYSAERLLEASLRAANVTVEGIFTHFANADELDVSRSRKQLERFEEVLSFYDRRSLPMPLRHAANSGAISCSCPPVTSISFDQGFCSSERAQR